MPFPVTQRNLYRKNPLDRVVCQLRFPPILRIETTLPADFQEAIRSQYPNFAEGPGFQLQLPADMAEELPAEIIKQLVQGDAPAAKNYEFGSEDGIWKVNLTRTFLALTTTKYERWELFKDRLNGPLKALIDTYAPDHFSRVGLRYVDVIRRSALGLSGVPWHELLAQHLSGLLGSPEVGASVDALESTYILTLDDGSSSVRILTKFVKAKADGEVCFMIDSDFFKTKKTRLEEVIEKLDYFNKRSSRLMRWSVTDRLHNAMEPEAI